jgi:predicted ferric reductase
VTQPHTWWYLARASGLVAWALLSASVLWGLLLSTRVFDRSISPKWLTDLHRFLGGTAVLFTAMHIATLVTDSYVHFGAKEVLLPFASAWRPVAVAWGVIAFWILMAVEATSLLMKHLPRRLWHAIHLSSFVLFFAATAHAITAGTDTRTTSFVIGCAAALSTVALLTLVRVLVPRQRGAGAARGTAAVADNPPVAKLELVTAARAPSADVEPSAVIRRGQLREASTRR